MKRIIITSTVGVVLGDSENEVCSGTLHPSPPLAPSPLLINPEQTIQPIQPILQGLFNESGHAYLAFKRLAYRATTEFIAANKPSFTIVDLMPTFIVGAWELTTSLASLDSGSYGFALSAVLGRKFLSSF